MLRNNWKESVELRSADSLPGRKNAFSAAPSASPLSSFCVLKHFPQKGEVYLWFLLEVPWPGQGVQLGMQRPPPLCSHLAREVGLDSRPRPGRQNLSPQPGGGEKNLH